VQGADHVPTEQDRSAAHLDRIGLALDVRMGGLILLACLAGPGPSSDPKSVVRRLVDDVMNAGRLDVIDEIYTRQMASAARRWITPFRESFPDVRMDILDLIAEGDKVVARFHCSGTNLGPWRGDPPTGRRFERVDEVYIFRIVDGRIAEAWGLEDSASRERQLGLSR
jgi:predicted ester cyclase